MLHVNIGMTSGNFGTTTFITEMMEPNNVNVTWRIYYPGGGMRVQTSSGNSLSFLVQDHLNSTSLTLNTSGSITGEMVYSAWGETRYSFGATPTYRLYTGQYEAEAGLYFYNARWYDSHLGRFAQADSIVPNPGNPQSWDRYGYVNNNPIRYSDPSGNIPIIDDDENGNPILNYPEYGDQLLERNNSEQYLLNKMVYPVEGAGVSNVTSQFGRFNTIASLNHQGSKLELWEWIEKYGLHMGVDIDGKASLNIVAIYYGTVILAMESSLNGGNKIVIMHEIGGQKYFSVYFHLNSINVSVGQSVSPGEIIGIMGDSAAYSIHLHFEVRTAEGYKPYEPGDYNNVNNLIPYWACNKNTYSNNWVDISSLFGGYSPDIPENWR